VVVVPLRQKHLEPVLTALELRLKPGERDELSELFS